MVWNTFSMLAQVLQGSDCLLLNTTCKHILKINRVFASCQFSHLPYYNPTKRVSKLLLLNHTTLQNEKKNTLTTWVAIVLLGISILKLLNNLIKFHHQIMLLTRSGEVKCITFEPIHTRQSSVYFATILNFVITSILKVQTVIFSTTKFC